MLIIKVTFANDTRRIAVERVMSYAVLQQLVRNMFSGLQQSQNEMIIKYLDEEGDNISLTTDFELEEAFRQCTSQPQVLRLSVSLGSAPSPQLPKPSSDSELLSFTLSDFKKDDKAAPIAAPVEVPAFEPQAPAPAPAPVPATIPVSEAPAVAAIPRPQSTSPAQRPGDLPVLQLLEVQLSAALKAISSFMDSLHIDQTMTEVVADIHSNMKKATLAAQEHILNPLSAMTKSKSAVAADHLQKLKQEIAKLKALLEVEFGKAMDKITQLASNPEETKAPVPVPAPVSEAPVAAPLKPVDQQPAPCPGPSPAETAPQVQLAPPTDVAKLVQDDLKRLADMGFTDRSRNLVLLAQFNGDLSQVIEALIQ